MLSRVAARSIALLSGHTPSVVLRSSALLPSPDRLFAVAAPASVGPRVPRVSFGSVAASDAHVDTEQRQAVIKKSVRQLEEAQAELTRLRLEPPKGWADAILRAQADEMAPASVGPRVPRVTFGSFAASDAHVDAEQIQAAVEKATRQLEEARAELARLKLEHAKSWEDKVRFGAQADEIWRAQADEIRRAQASVSSAHFVLRLAAEECNTASLLVDLVKAACANVTTFTPFKADPMTWGVTRDNDPRMASRRGSGCKSPQPPLHLPQHLETVAKLREYMSAPSRSREPGLGDFSIAVAPCVGKTRLFDDALRLPLDTTHFAHVLRVAIAFYGHSFGAFAHPVATRMLREFFCRPTEETASWATTLMRNIDEMLTTVFSRAGRAGDALLCAARRRAGSHGAADRQGVECGREARLRHCRVVGRRGRGPSRRRLHNSDGGAVGRGAGAPAGVAAGG
jgi:hypothetical protein